MPDNDLIYELLSWCGFLISAAFGNPIPEEIMVASAGVRAGVMHDRYGAFRFLLLPACMIGAIIADLGLYFLGRVFGTRLLEYRLFKRLAPAEKRERTRQNFERYGVIILVVGRLVPGIRTTLFLTAGMIRLSVPCFLLADGLGALLGNTIFFMLGYWLGAWVLEVIWAWENQVSSAKPIIILLVLVAVAVYLIYLLFRRPIPTGDPKELPLIGGQIAAHLPTKPTTEQKIMMPPAPVANAPGSPPQIASGEPGA